MKILSIHDLATIRKKAEHNLLLREESNEKVSEKCYGLSSGAQHLQILICGGTGCKASSSQGITDNLLKAIEKNGITGKVEVITVGCFGFCEKGPIVKIIPDNTFYTQVTPEDAEEIINEHIIGGRRIERLLYVSKISSSGFFIKYFSRAIFSKASGFVVSSFSFSVSSLSLIHIYLVLFTGDLVNNVATELDEFIPILEQIKGKDGVYSVLGST